MNDETVYRRVTWVLLVVSFCLLLLSNQQRDELEKMKAKQEPVTVKIVSSRGLVGKIVDKSHTGNRYTVTVGAYGKFLVTKEQYESLNIGDDAPEELKKRGS